MKKFAGIYLYVWPLWSTKDTTQCHTFRFCSES